MSKYTAPIYLKRWLGRPFILDFNSIKWGRYSINIPWAQNSSDDVWKITAAALCDAEPGKIAMGFEQLISVQLPHALLDYLAEISALYTYELAKENLTALRRINCEPHEYITARANVAARFEDALSTIFNSASTLHCLGIANAVRYCQMLHGMHDVAIFIQDKTYYAAFTPDLVLESIAGHDNFRIWPPYPPSKSSNGSKEINYE